MSNILPNSAAKYSKFISCCAVVSTLAASSTSSSSPPQDRHHNLIRNGPKQFLRQVSWSFLTDASCFSRPMHCWEELDEFQTKGECIAEKNLMNFNQKGLTKLGWQHVSRHAFSMTISSQNKLSTLNLPFFFLTINSYNSCVGNLF